MHETYKEWEENYKIWVDGFLQIMLKYYHNGEIYAFLLGGNPPKEIISWMRQMHSHLTCKEIGATAELNRIKSFLEKKDITDYPS